MATKELALDVAARPRPAPPQARTEAAPGPRSAAPMPQAGLAATNASSAGLGASSATAPDVVSRARASIMLQQSVGNARMATMGAEVGTRLPGSLPVPQLLSAVPARPAGTSLTAPATRAADYPTASSPTQQAAAPVLTPAQPAKPVLVASSAAPPGAAGQETGAAAPAATPGDKEATHATARKSGKGSTGAAPAKSPADAGAPAEEGKTAPAAKTASGKAKRAVKKGEPGKEAGEGDGEAKAEAKAGAKRGGRAVPIKMPEAPAGLSPAAHARVGAATSGAAHAAAAHAALAPASDQVADARAGVTEPSAESNARAAADLVTALGQRPAPSPEIEELCKKIYKVIRDKRPPDEDSLVKADPEEMGKAAGGEMDASVQGGVKKLDQSYQPLGQQPQGAAGQQGQPIPAAPDAAGTPPINADQAKPDAVPAKNVDLKADAADSKERMDKAGMNKEPAKLVQSGPIAEAREAQGDLEKAAAEDPAKVLADQQATLTKTGADLAALQKAALASLNGSRKSTVSHASGQQKQMVGSEESMRTKASAEAQSIFTNAQNQVNALLQPLPQTAKAKWDAGVKLATTKFKQRLKKVEDWIKDRHSGGWGAVVSLWDDVTGLPGWVTDEYDAAEQTFGDEICATAREISSDVNGIILTCETIIANARSQIAGIFAALPASLQAWAAGEQAKLGEQLDGLAKHAHEVRDNFNKELIQSASQAVQDVREQVHALREKAKGLIGRVMDAINRFLDDPAKFLLEALLEILGIPPSAFWAVVNKIKKVINDIADDPMKFANNLMDAIGKGFSQFFDHIGDHLLRGFIDWLTGGLGSLGIQLPKDASLKSILTFMLQLMGITWPRIRKLLAKHIGEENVALLEKVYSLVSTLIELGPEGVFELIKEQLNPQNILDMIIKAAVDYMIKAVVKAVSVRIIMLFNPVGAILEALEAIYRVLKWIFQNAARIFRLIETVVNGIADIIAGNIGGMANAVEGALAMLIPPVIDFLADYLGFGDLPATIRETIEGFQESVMEVLETVLVWLIEKGKALLAAVGLGGKDDKDKEKNADEGAIGKKVTWTAADTDHQLWVSVQGENAVVMMASDDPAPVEKHLEDYAKQAEGMTSEADKDKKSAALTGISEAKAALSPVDKEADEAVSLVKKPEHDSNEFKAKEQEVETGEDALKTPLAKIQEALPPKDLPETKVVSESGAKKSVTAEPLSEKEGNTQGSEPFEDPPGWQHIANIRPEELDPKRKLWGPAYRRRVHLLNHNLHGPGAAWNLVTARETENSRMKVGPEKGAKERVLDKQEVLYYHTEVTFHSAGIPEGFPKTINVVYGSMKYENQNWVRAGQIGTLELEPEAPPLGSGEAVAIDTLGRPTLRDTYGFPPELARNIADESQNGAYGSSQAFLARMKDRYSKFSRPVDFEAIYWPQVQSLMSAGNLKF